LSLQRLFKVLFSLKPNISVDAVGFGNVAVALGVLVTLGWGFHIGFVWSAIGGALAFILLCACLLNRYTLWVAAVLGGLVFSTASTALLAGLGLRLFGNPGAWLGGILGFILGFVGTVKEYRDVWRRIHARGD
jgi:hypothetical protein